MSFSIGKRVWAIPMPATDKLVLLALAHYADDNGQCWPSLDKLGKDTGLHPKSVSRCIRRLKKRKLIETKRRMNSSSIVLLKI
jgi:DNA-binding MarR family transcriptional regulator